MSFKEIRIKKPEDLADQSNGLTTLLLAFGYCIGFWLLNLFLHKANFVASFPSANSLSQFDANVYAMAAKKGYYYTDEQSNNMGIFILFPWIWKLSHLGIVGISIVNMALFACAFTLITRICPISRKEQFFWLTTPSLYFMMVPYSEALFCLLIALTFYGIVANKKWISSIALFLAAFCRPTAIFIIPTFLFMAVLKSDRKQVGKSLKEACLYYILPTLISSGLFTLYQYKVSGVWFSYYKGQAKYLGHQFALPTLPFSDYYGGERITWLDGLSLLPGTICLIFAVVKLHKWIRHQARYPDQAWLMTLCYVPIVMMTMIFCNPTWGTLTTNLLGSHRYIFCSPFFFIFLYHTVAVTPKYKMKDFLLVIILCNVIWLSMGSYIHITTFIFYNFLTLLVMGYMLHANNKNTWVTFAICSFNVFLQISLFQQYLGGLFTE